MLSSFCYYSDQLSLCPEPCLSNQRRDTSVLRAIFTCDIATILSRSQQIIAYAQMRLYVPTFPLLFDKLGKFNPLPYKIQPGCIAGTCNSVGTIAAKTIRLRMRNVEPLLQYDPKIKVVYYTRDPHGIISSLTKAREVHNKTIDGICAVMEDDFWHYQRLKAAYPDRFMWLRYEDLALHPERYAKRVYEFTMGKECVPPSVYRWIKENTNVPRSQYNGMTGTKRNSTANAREWQTIVSSRTKEKVNVICAKVLKMLKYDVPY